MGDDRWHRCFENLEKACYVNGAGRFNTPIILPDDIPDTFCRELVGIDSARGVRNRSGKGVHFFLDDYKFVRVWNRPDEYLPLLKSYDFVLSPDFSLYTDYPLIVQLYNHYRKHWLAAYWQENGVKVIPTIGWSDENSYAWCFDGEPTESTVAVSAQGTQATESSRLLFLKGYNAMLDRLNPKKILFYGIVPKECDGNIVQIDAFVKRLYKMNGRCYNGR